MTAGTTTTPPPARPRKERPRWVRRLHRLFVYIDTMLTPEWSVPAPPKREP